MHRAVAPFFFLGFYYDRGKKRIGKLASPDTIVRMRTFSLAPSQVSEMNELRCLFIV